MDPLHARHGDVLNAAPDSDASRAALVEELKRRGNVAFQAKSFPEAIALYSKAIEHDPELPALFGNRSAARAGMNELQPALADADEAVRLQDDWPKGHFRRGQALQKLGRLREAVAAFERASELAPDDAKLRKQLVRARKQAEDAPAEAPAPAPARAPAPAPAAAQAKSQPPALESPPSKSAKKSGGAKRRSSKKHDSDDEDDDVDAAKVRGYRVLEDGRKTTFFHHEQTEEEKRLIGDIAPKKIDASAAREVEAAPAAGSAWNQGGTYEERTLTGWAQEQLTAALVGVHFRLPGGEADVETTALSNFEGDANICVIRGSLRHIMLASFTVAWRADFDGAEVTGELRFEDASADLDEELDVQGSVTTAGIPQQRRDLLQRHVIRGGLLGELTERYRAFVGEFLSR